MLIRQDLQYHEAKPINENEWMVLYFSCRLIFNAANIY